MELCQNDSKSTESIKEAGAICACATLDAEALCSATIKEAKATCTCTVWEAEAIWSAALRGAETWGASKADSLKWRHVKTIQHLEEQFIQEEGRSNIDFLSACQGALQVSPGELRGVLVASYHLLMGQAPRSTHLPYHKEPPQSSNCLPQQLLLLLHLTIPPGPSVDTPRPSGQHASWQDHIQGNLGRAP